MFETTLPPLAGVLAPGPDPRMLRWQRALGELYLPEGLLALADDLAALAPGLEPEARKDLTLLVLVLLAEQEKGSTCLALDDPELAARYLKALEGAQAPPWARLLAVLDRAETGPLAGPAGAGTPLVREGQRLFSQRYCRSEAGLAALVRARMGRPAAPRRFDERFLAIPDQLSGEQRKAVQLALDRPLALVTGGPGTGKTSIVVAMLRALLHGHLGLGDILLAAPTGKAAQRMGEAIRRTLGRIPPAGRDQPDQDLLEPGLEPQTLHRLLGWNPGRGAFLHHAGNLLAARLVIVDEASMISQELMEALFAAVPPEAALVLLGDPDQLPSVDAGRTFQDLVRALPAANQALVHSFRMGTRGGHILKVADAVNRGAVRAFQAGPEAAPRRQRPEDLAFQGVEFLEPAGNLAPFLAAWMATRIWTQESGAAVDPLLKPPIAAPRPGESWSPADLERIRALVRNYDRSRVLCPVNQGPALMSVDSLNDFFHALALDRARGELEETPRIIVGEPVMVLRNDYRRNLFNGDQGVVMMVRRQHSDQPHVFFPRGQGFVSFPLAGMREQLTLSYAMSVHKAQGSEFDRVALVVPAMEGEFITRGILYTALTRAREVVTVLAREADWTAGAERQDLRLSSLPDRL